MMRENIIEQLRFCASRFSCEGCGGKCSTSSNEPRAKAVLIDAADAIEELLAFAYAVAKMAVNAEEDEVSAEVLCRKLYKLGIIEKDGAWWWLPEPPKEVK